MIRFTAIFAALLSALPLAAAGRVLLVADPAPEPPARYGLARLEKALQARGFAVERSTRAASPAADWLILAGAGPGGAAAQALRTDHVTVPQTPEALVIHPTKLGSKPALVLCGADSRGLMYAALDAADRISWSAAADQPFAHIRETSERPYVHDRAISMYTMQRAYFESRLYDEAHWQRYFDLLAASRINRFVVIFGYENGGFMAPPYPYFFDLAQFPEVKLVGLSPQQQARNVAAFHAMIRAAHERGIEFTAAIWDHIYRGGVQGGGIEGASALAGQRVPGLVWGVTADNLAAYTKAALRRFLEVFPEIDSLQFRMHDESGLKHSEMEGFWHEVFAMMRQVSPRLSVDIRAKGLPDSIIQDGLRQGLRLRVSTKYWMEQMGMPFHPTHVNRQNQHDRRHGYADLLRYPQQYQMQWQLWNGGTTRLLLWADPDYVRRFAASVHLYQGDSFEVNEMLATKMLGEPHDAPPRPILNPRYRYYDYEFERYWHFYQLWGRLTYNPSTAPDIWQHEFERRFGPAAGAELMSGLHLASRVLPRIVAASYPYSFFPTTRGWAEMMRMGDLPKYAAEHTTDTAQFMSASTRARNIVEGVDNGMRTPEQTSQWFAKSAEQILAHVARAEKIAGEAPSKELIATATDLKILACLAQYHSHRLRAAVPYSLFQVTGERDALDEAIAAEKEAVAAWERLVRAAGDVYSDQLAFGVHRVGFSRHWKEELEKLRQGLVQLETEREKARSQPAKARMQRAAIHTTSDQPPEVQLERPAIAQPGQDLWITARAADASSMRRLRLYYRHVNQYEDYQSLDMTLDRESGSFQAKIPGDFIIPRWDLMYYVEVIDNQGNGRLYPDLEIEAPYVVVPLRR